jgi:hypothetical protein
MNDNMKLTQEQKDRIEKTLKRIRDGLNRSAPDLVEEPSHVFVPEVSHAAKK